jgi:hypothetical protein
MRIDFELAHWTITFTTTDPANAVLWWGVNLNVVEEIRGYHLIRKEKIFEVKNFENFKSKKFEIFRFLPFFAPTHGAVVAFFLGFVFVIVVELAELYNFEVTCNSVKSWRNGGPPPENSKKSSFSIFRRWPPEILGLGCGEAAAYI